VKRYPVIFETTPCSFDKVEYLSSYSFTIAQHSVVRVDTNDYNTNNVKFDSFFTLLSFISTKQWAHAKMKKKRV
jgi:hypothetical protein